MLLDLFFQQKSEPYLLMVFLAAPALLLGLPAVYSVQVLLLYHQVVYSVQVLLLAALQVVFLLF